MKQDSVEEAERLMEANGVPCLRVRSIKELADSDEHIKAREMMVEIDQPFVGKMKMYGNPMKFSETPAGVRGHGPLLGEHNEEIFTSVLGATPEQIQQYYDSGIIHKEEAVDRLEK